MHQSLRRLPGLLLVFALLLCTIVPMHAQSLLLFDVDASAFPTITAQFILRDNLGNLITGTETSDYTLTENGVPMDIFQTSCPPTPAPTPITAVLVCDRSGSMSTLIGKGPLTRMALLKAGVSSFIRSTHFVDPTSLAITSFNRDPEIVSDFSSDTTTLLNAVNSLRAASGTDYNPAFLDTLLGAIPMLRARPSEPPRHIIFITDGQPMNAVLIDSITAKAVQAQIKIHVITLGMPMHPALQTIAEQTGGLAFANILDESELRGVYTSIAMRAQGIRPCTITWHSITECDAKAEQRNVVLTYTPLNVSGRSSYRTPESAKMVMKVSSTLLYFGAVAPQTTVFRDITLTARGGPFDITDAVLPPGTPFAITNWGGTPPPFQIPENASRTIQIGFTPPLAAIYTTTLRFLSQTCPIPAVTLNGGKLDDGPSSYLKLLAPTGGEIFAGCDSVLIRWAGISPDETITIEYSDNNGSIWQKITDEATGLLYHWTPPHPGSAYRIRISQLSGTRIDTVGTAAGLGSGLTDTVTDARIIGPSSFAISGDLLFLAEEGGHVVKMIDTRAGRYSTVAGTGANGYTGDDGDATQAKLYNPSGVALHDGYLFIADQSNHAIRRVDLVSGIITTVAGNGAPGFQGDGGPATAAYLNYPTHLAVAQDMLYIADRGNNRIRRIDLRTGIITTIAGGGLASGDGPLPATDMALSAPAGMTIVSDELNRNDTLYFAEEGGHRIRRISLRNLALTTAVGDGIAGYLGDGGRGTEARLSSPRDVVAAGALLYIADTRNYRVREFNRMTHTIRTFAGSGRNNYSGDNGPATQAAFSQVFGVAWKAPNAVYVADFNNSVVRSVLLGDFGRRDSSSSSFTVTTALLRTSIPGRTVEFGNLATDASRDSSITSAICNQGTAPTAIETITVEGAHREDFIVVSGMSAEELLPGDCRTIEIRFAPQGLGRRTARVIVSGRCSKLDTIFLSGTGLPSCGLALKERIDLGEVEVGNSSGDLLIRDVICNNGIIALNGHLALETTETPFAIVSGGGAFTLLPGQCHEVMIRFTPAREGRSTAQLDYGIATSCGGARTTLVGKGTMVHGIEVVPEVTFPAIACDRTGQDTTIIIRNAGAGPLVITGAELITNADGFVLLPPVPTADTPITILPGMVQELGIRFQPTTYGAKSATLRITSANSANATDVALTGRYNHISVAPDDPLLAFDGRLPAAAFPRDSVVVLRNSGTSAITVTAGTIGGPDPDKFAIMPDQFPLVIAPHDTAHLVIQVLEPVIGNGYRALLTLAYEPDCGEDLTVELLEVGAQPAISAHPPHFRDLLCQEESGRDTLLNVRNPGGGELRITAYEIRGADPGAFSFAVPLPIIVPAGESLLLPIRFVPPTSGTFSAELAITSNASSDETLVPLAGRREISSIAISGLELRLGHILPGGSASTSIPIRNTGTTPVSIPLPAVIGPFAVVTASPLTLAPGQEKEIEITLNNANEGEYHDTLRLDDLPCGYHAMIPISASVFTPAYTVVDLPEESAAPGARVSLPIRISIPDPVLFTLKGARAYTTIITFNGAILSPVEAIGATIVAQTYDPATMLRRVTLAGEYPGVGDTLATLICNVPMSTLVGTPLTFEEFSWDHPHVFPETLDGSFTMLDTCYLSNMVARPKVLKIRPMPAGDAAVAEIELEDVLSIRASIIDPLGQEVALIAEGRYNKGRYELPLALHGLASGLYTLIIDTPFGRTTERIVIAR